MDDAEEHAGGDTRASAASSAKVAERSRTVTDVASGDTSLSRAAVGVSGGLPNGGPTTLRGDYSAVSDSRASLDTRHDDGQLHRPRPRRGARLRSITCG